MLLPGLGVSYEMFLPLISLLEDRFHIVAMEVDGFIIGEYTRFTSIDDQAGQAIAYVKENLNGRLDCAYGLSMGGMNMVIKIWHLLHCETRCHYPIS